MFSQPDLERLVAAMRETGVSELEVDGPEGRVLLALPATAALGVIAAPAEPVATPVLSPAMGRFKPCGVDDGLAALQPGASVRAGQVLGYVASDAALLAISAPFAGVLGAGLPQDDQVIGYGDTVFEVEGPA